MLVKLRCPNCGTPFNLNKEQVHIALDDVMAHDYKHFNAVCPSCGRQVKVAKKVLRRAAPTWKPGKTAALPAKAKATPNSTPKTEKKTAVKAKTKSAPKAKPKTAAKKTPAKKTPTKKTPAKKPPTKKTPAKKTATKTTGATGKKTTSKTRK
jgi:endogenous inhibitor of DNA gyrase (YacG/DUF329 family)